MKTGDSNTSNDQIGTGNTTIQSVLLNSTYISVTYHTLTNNHPKLYGNVISVWQGTQIGWGSLPIASSPIEKDSQDGDLIVQVPPDKTPPYTVGYGTSGAADAYCAAQTLPATGSPFPMDGTVVTVPYIGTDSILVSFSTPAGNEPKNNENWIGLWLGTSPTYDESNLIVKVNVTSTVSSGSQSLNGLTLLFSTDYTVAYACGARNTDLAAWCAFKTQPYLNYLWQTFYRRLRSGLRKL